MSSRQRGARSPAASGPAASVVRGGADAEAEQGSIYRQGVSRETVGSEVLWLGIISLPAGKRTRAHLHEGHETALYMMDGTEIEILSGSELQHRELVRPGDYIFIPAGVPHVAVNRTGSTAVFMGSRNDPCANESVVMRPELDALVREVPDPVAGGHDGHH